MKTCKHRANFSFQNFNYLCPPRGVKKKMGFGAPIYLEKQPNLCTFEEFSRSMGRKCVGGG